MNITRIIASATFFIGVISAIPLANIGGVCIARREVAPDDEILSIAHSKAFDDAQLHYQVGQAQSPKRPLRLYTSQQEFDSTNPNCCQLSDSGTAGMTFGLFDRMRGLGRTFVQVTYLDKNWTTGPDLTRTIHFAVGNCGEFWDGIDQPI